jgi:hypothetical protein
MYAETIPDAVVSNLTVYFKKNVTKAMKYHEKYKDADAYTLATKVPDKYRDFIPIAKKIQDSDEIVIKNPFFVYETEGNTDYRYYFVAERNGERLCLFSICIDSDTGKISFWYDKSMDQYFSYDEKTMEDGVFYKINDITYVQTPEKTTEVRNQTNAMLQMDGGSSDNEEFAKKSYEEKKEEIFAYLAKIKKGKAIKKSEKNLKLALENEYIEPEKDKEESGIGKGIYMVSGVVVIMGIAVWLILWKKRKKEQPEVLLMKYIFKNICSFAKYYKKIFALLIITISASTVIIHLSYGMFREYRDRKELSRSATKQVVFRLKSSYAQKSASDSEGSMTQLGDLSYQTYERQKEQQDVTVADVKRFAGEVDAETADKLLNIHTGILQGDYRFETDFLIADGKIVNSGDYGFESLYNFTFGGQTMNTFQYGRYFTDKEYAEGSKVCIMYGFQKNLRGEYLEKYLVDDANVRIGDATYQIIGLQNGIGTGYLPITSVDGDSVLLDEIALQFRDNISLREINLLNDAAQKCFGNRVTSNYELEETEDNDYLYNTILLLVLVVSLVAAFNFCALYHYIVTTRRRTLNIFRICGLSRTKSIRLYLGECSILSAGTYLVTLFLFHFLLMPFLADKRNVFDFHYRAEVYLVLFLIYFVSSFLMQCVMLAWNLKKEIIR